MGVNVVDAINCVYVYAKCQIDAMGVGVMWLTL